ncbi:NACHT domain protein [Aspergillus japonicus CBS 114.51]|uniref:NACHT domain protein n=1 Tax=Aspergillus japonicus CBS 114.51 TaxID=1448312 RepID=A0A8T8WQ66_ASPJA|nr:NACHT domain protein [Aspergillus japonicus CBS 114.51]RAH77834.1 NACHT domain protein [Aspergillus japonicus CBS 114.51]
MAPAVLSPAPTTPNVAFPLSPSVFSKSRRTSGFLDSDSISNHGMSRSVTSRRVSSRKFQSFETSNITNVVHSLKRRSGDEIGATASSKLLNATHASLIDWIRTQRMSLLPPEGSSYDKVLAWAQLFVDRLHSFDLAIEEFAGDSYLAAQLAYGYCALLLELGKGNESALMISFGFFYSTSMALVNLLERIELFNVTQEIREQLVLALADLVTLVASVATYFHQAIRGMTGNSATVNIYAKFPGQIQAFRQRCEKIAESMWKHQLQEKGLDGARVSDVKTIRSWLAPEDTVLANVAETTSHLAHDREEMTCVWVGPHLTRFLRNRQQKTFAITGKSGSGKTVLSSVIVDHLQHPIGGVMHKTLYIPINGRLPAETRPRAIVKTILFQLFEKRIGNTQLFQILWDAFERSKRAPNDNDYDNILWNALEHALSAALKGAKELVIVMDGVDEAACDEAVLLQKLTSATAKATNVKLITLGAQDPPSLPGLRHHRITDDGIYEDICAVVRGQFEKSDAYDSLDEMGQSFLVSQLTSASKGSFLWAKLASKRVRDVDNADNLRKAVDALVNAKPTITDLVLQILNELPQAQTREDAKLMLLWLATAERPLLVKELKALASIHPEKQTITEYTEEPLRVLHPVNSLVFLQEGQVFLRHSLIRTAILDIFSKGKLVPAIKDRHADLVTRLLVYIKATVTQPHEPSLTPLDWHDVNPLINKHPLLEFSIRYWITHFRQTNVFVNNGEVPAAKEFAKLFPSSITVFLLQNTLWENRPTPELLAFTTTVTNVCRQILTNNHVVTLQVIITLAFLYRQLDYIPESIPLFYEATIISRSLLTIRHLVTMKMAATFLEVTTERVTSTKTEIMAKREEVLLVLIECYKHHHDSTHENVINTLKQLIEHYKLIKEDKKAEEYTITIQKLSGEYSQGRDTHGNLNVHLKGGNVVTAGGSTTLLLDIEEHDQLIEVEAWSFEKLIKQAERYVAEAKFELAERTYVEIWQRLSRESRVQYSTQVEERKIQSVLAYSQFLKTQKREYEASSILSSVWQEYEQTNMALSETSVFHLQEMAKVMKTVGLATLALTVFKHCSHYYQSTNRTQSSTYQEIQQSIHTTSKEVMQSFSSSSTTVTSETTLEEMVYEASTSITTVDQTSFSATQTLVSLYVEQRRWQDATRVIKKVLHGVWSSLFAPSLQDVTLPAKHVESCIELAERLSHCYQSRRRVSKEEDIRVRIYRAVRSGRKVDDKLRERITNELLRLFERTSQTDKIINLRQETLNDYIKHYGPENPLVVKILWILAELTRPRPVFVDYYQQIIRILNKDSPTSHPEAFEPLVIVATELWKQGRYSDALQHYQIIFTTFLSEPKQSPKFQDQTFVHEFFERYTHCLRSVRTEFSALHQVTVEYQTKCKAVFSAKASITLKATLTLAKLCQESKRYELEAISLYEELLKTQSDEIDLQEISSTLDAIYEEQAAIVTSTKTESFSSTQVERAVKVLRKRISTVRETHGWAHEESLTKMEEMIKFHAQRNETQTVVQELKEATVQILSSETSSTRLIAAATTIASSYIATNQIQKATELTQEIYRQIVMKDTSNSKSVQFDLSSKERQSLTFLAQLEYSLRRSSSTTITEILAALTTEYVYFEDFRKEIKSKSSFHSVSVSAARLYQFLIAHERHTAAARVFDDFVTYFIDTEGKRAQLTEVSQVKIFVLSILDHFSTHQSENFIRSVGITSNDHVVELLKNQRWETASDLALAAYKYIIAHDSYHTPEIVKFVFTLGLNIGGRDLVTRPDEATRKKLLQVSGTIIQDALRVITSLKINLAGVSLVHLNKLIGLLGEQQDYRTLAWLLTILWNSREAQRNWPTSITLALGRRFIMARYFVGDYSAALRLAEDIVYNCRRVHGPRHPSTLEMSILLSQLYTGNAQRYQAEKNGQEIANRFYKKSAAVHENILRVFSDPDYAELEGIDSNGSFDGSAYGEVDGIGEHNGTVGGGEHVRQHLHLLKLSVERLGDWPKDYAEYEKLNADVFREYEEYLTGVEGVEKWNLKNFGGGKAESNEDVLDLKFKSWELVDTQHHAEIEEEL